MTEKLFNDLYTNMPWDRIDSVVFDIGDVLVKTDINKVFVTLFPEDTAIQDIIRLRTTRTPYWHQLDLGLYTKEEVAHRMAGNRDDLYSPILRFLKEWPDYHYVVEEGRRTVLKCKERGKKLYLLSNYPEDNFQRNLREFEFFSLFDGYAVSSYEHVLKPHAEIYKALQDRYQLVPEKTLFIDDMTANIEGAFNLGWQGICYNQPGCLDAFFKD